MLDLFIRFVFNNISWRENLSLC